MVLRQKRSRTTRPRTRILVADDLPIDRSGLVAILERQRDFVVVGEATDTQEAISLSRKLRPSVLILALRLKEVEGRSALAAVHAASPETPILAVAERGQGQCLVLNPPGSRRHSGDDHVPCAAGTDCLQLAIVDGASGTIRRDSTPEELFQAIRTVATGRSWYESGGAAPTIMNAFPGNGREPDSILSPRELEVAELIANGRSNKEISTALRITEPTVKKHVGRILAKLGLQDRLQVGLYVARNPLVLQRLSARRF